MTHLSKIFPKCSIEPSWDRAQVAKALRSQRHRRNPWLKTAQVLNQWSVEATSEYDSRDLLILATLIYCNHLRGGDAHV